MNSANTLLLAIITFIVGFSIPTQAGINQQLARFLSSPVLAGLASFTGGALALAGYAVATQTPWPTVQRLSEVPWWAWTGGIFGVLFVTVTIIISPRLGATTTLSLLVGGQMVASLFFDHYGMLGFPEHPVNWMRVAGVALVIIGVLLVQRF